MRKFYPESIDSLGGFNSVY